VTASPLRLPLPALAEQFQLRRDKIFLNHGSFGACPRPVFDTYQAWQRELEADPERFFRSRVRGLLAEARAALARFIGADADDLVFVPNATHGANIVANALELRPGDEVLSTDHEYGAVERAWQFHCARRGARYVRQPIELPARGRAELVEQLFAGVTPRTRVICLSHISSFTAMIFPVAAICRRARELGILTVIDGAHAPGQVDLDLHAIGADFYLANCHKWLCAPKGSGFLYARRECQPLLQPFVVGWGWQGEGSPFLDIFEQLGTLDPAAYLSVPAAIAFQERHDWPRVRAACHALLGEARERILALAGTVSTYPAEEGWWAQMCVIPLPPRARNVAWQRLVDDYRIELPIIPWGDQIFARVSIQAYNTPAELDALVQALAELLGEAPAAD